MKTQVYPQIPEPCHEDWNKMTENEQGRFCGSCCKTVIDFQAMSDEQILHFFSHNIGNTCGRFSTDQLNRGLQEATKPKDKRWQWLLASVTSLFFFVNRGNSQRLLGKIAVKDVPEKVCKEVPKTKGKTKIIQEHVSEKPAVLNSVTDKLLEGEVLDEDKKPVAYAMVKLNFPNKTIQIMADSNGVFKCLNLMNHTEDSVNIEISSLGYTSEKRQISYYEGKEIIRVQLKPVHKELNEVVVTSYSTTIGRIQAIGGSVVVGKSVEKITTIPSLLKNIFKQEAAFKVFPNPIARGNVIYISLQELGNFSIQFIDNQSRLLSVKNVNVKSKQQLESLNISAITASGVYYIQLINLDTKKQFVQKVLVQ